MASLRYVVEVQTFMKDLQEKLDALYPEGTIYILWNNVRGKSVYMLDIEMGGFEDVKEVDIDEVIAKIEDLGAIAVSHVLTEDKIVFVSVFMAN